MHPLIRLNRSYCAGDITLESVFNYLRRSAPELVIEVPDTPDEDLTVTPVIYDSTPPPVEAPKDEIDEWVEKASTAQLEKHEQVVQQTEWMNTYPKQSYPYDDFGSLKPQENW